LIKAKRAIVLFAAATLHMKRLWLAQEKPQRALAFAVTGKAIPRCEFKRLLARRRRTTDDAHDEKEKQQPKNFFITANT